MAFRDLQFNIGKLTTNVKSQVAKNNPLQNQDTRALNLWLFEERNDLANMKTTAYHHTETNKAFLDWVNEEKIKNNQNIYSQDIEDIGSGLHQLLEKQVELEKQYTDRYQLYRRALKSIREREKEMTDFRDRKQSIMDRIQHLKRTNPTSKKIDELENDLQEINDNKMITNNDNGYKRFILKEAFYLRFNALQEYAEKMAILAGFGKYLVDLLEEEEQQQELLLPNSDMIVMDALLSVDGWQSSNQRHTIQDELLKSHDGDDNAVVLTDKEIIATKEKSDKVITDDTISKEEEEFNEKATNNYFHQLYRHVSTQHYKKKQPPYAEFQRQFIANVAAAATTTTTTANNKMDDEPISPLLSPPPAYSHPANNNFFTFNEEEKRT